MIKKLLIVLLVLAFLVLVGCSAPQEAVCNKPYFEFKLGDCCLDSNNNNICDTDEGTKAKIGDNIYSTVSKEAKKDTSNVVVKNNLITKSAVELALYSNEIEAGYSLDRGSSGIYVATNLSQFGLKEAFVTDYYKLGTESSEERNLRIYSFTFDNIDESSKAYEYLEKKFIDNSLYEEKDWTSLDAGDESVVFLKNFEYDFKPFKRYIGIIRTKNTVSEIQLFTAASETVGTELVLYLNKLEEKALSNKVLEPEVNKYSKSKLGLDKENVLEIELRETTRKSTIPRGEEYKYYKPDSLTGTDKNYLIANFYLKNIGYSDNLKTSTNNFLVIDEKGNYYTADYYSFVMEESKAGETLRKKSGLPTAYAFPVYRNSKEFTLRIYDNNLLVYEKLLVSYAEKKTGTFCIAPSKVISGRCCLDDDSNNVCDTDEKVEIAGLIKVDNILDGDSIVILGGKSIDLIGVDAPEKSEYHYMQSSHKLAQLVAGKKIMLEKDVTETSDTGLILGYVFLGDTFINELLIKEGYAKVKKDNVNTKYSHKLQEAENYAKENKLGLWQEK